jgi:hypothetical protein
MRCCAVVLGCDTMFKRFDSRSTRATRALQVWLILIGKAHNRQIMTYGMLADLLGFKGAGVLAQILGHVMYYCQDNKLPPLTILVVNQRTGLPGEGLIGADLNADRETVFNHPWYEIHPPTAEQIADVYAAHQ